MVNAIEIQKVTQDVLLFVWFKHGSISGKECSKESGLIPEISDELMNNLSTSIWIESFRTKFIWNDFFKKHFERMTSTSKLFGNYVAYVCYVLNESSNAYECFFDILSIVSEFSLRCLEGDRLAYVNTCAEIFCSFFEKELRKKFEDQGGWKKFNEYIRKYYKLIQSKEMMSDNNTPVESYSLFEYFEEALGRGDRTDYVDNKAQKIGKPYFEVNRIVLKNITPEQVETHEKATRFIECIQDKMEELVQEPYDELSTIWDTYNQVKEDSCNRMESEEELTWQFPKHRRKKKRVEQCHSLEIQESSVGNKSNWVQSWVQKPPFRMRRNEMQQKTDQEHPVCIKGNEMQWKIEQKHSWVQIEDLEEKRDSKPLDVIKRLDVQDETEKEPPGERKIKEYQPKTYQKLPNGRKNKEFQQKIDQEPPGGRKSKDSQRKINQESTNGRKTKDNDHPVARKSNERQQKTDPPSVMEKKEKKLKTDFPSVMESKEKHPPSVMESKEKQQKTDHPSVMEKKEKHRKTDHPSVMERKEKKLKTDPASVMESKEKKLKTDPPETHVQIKREEGQQKTDQEPPSEMKSQETKRKIDQERSVRKKSKYVHRKTDEDSIDEFKSQAEQFSLTCDTIVSEKAPEDKTVTAQCTVENEELDSINFQDGVASGHSSHLEAKSTKTVKNLLGNVSKAIAKISEIIYSLCNEHGVPVKLQVDSNV